MANYTSTANVVLSVNGKQASQMLNKLGQEAQQLEKKILDAANAGDKATMKKLQRELTNTNRLMDQLRGSSSTAEQVLKRLDKATPKELNKALKQLRAELNNIERGTAAWDAQMAKIKAVKQELKGLNSEMSQSVTPNESTWSKLKGYWTSFTGGITAAIAALTGFINASREAVKAYAEMEQEMANVRKFTGMTSDEVEALNEEFKKIDTRTSREDLNKLAQEAGRLGKTSQEDVLGFVRAADKINVALDDLGDDATLKLSKLTGIFGDEERLGTEKALLSVGSVINELSQNCSAGAPYLAEFASRMGGVGSQAGMSVQEIMGFAAVLDSNNQALESSATALSQVIVRIYQDPAKYAKVAGLDVQKFSELVKTDMNAALIELLSTLNQAGSMDVLSPMFKDMGEKGSNAISTLATLANHIQDVKDQQLVANKAFEEATSIDVEFAVQNETLQAKLEKQEKTLHEITVELGQRLQPVINLVNTTTIATMKAVSILVEFIIKYRREILSLAAGIAAYTIAININKIATTAWIALQRAGHATATIGKAAVLALEIAYFRLTGQVTKATAATRLFGIVTKLSPLGLLIGVITTLIGLLATYVMRTNEAKKAAAEHAKQVEEQRMAYEQWKKSLTDTNALEQQYCREELDRLKRLYNSATDEKKSKEERIQAAQALMKLYPDYFGQLSTEQIMVGQATQAYKDLRVSILEAARARAVLKKAEENYGQLLEKEEQFHNSKESLHQASTTYAAAAKIARLEIEKQAAKQVQDYRNAPGDNYTFNNIGAIHDNLRRRNNGNDVSDEQLTKALAANLFARADLQNSNLVSDETRGKLTAAASAMKKHYADKEQARKDIAEINKSLEYLQESNPEVFAENDLKAATENTPTLPPGGGGAGGGGKGNKSKSDQFAAEKEWRERQEALARISYATGQSDYLAHTKRMDEILVKFYEKQLQHTDISESERLTITAQWREAQAKQRKNAVDNLTRQEIEQEQAANDERMTNIKQFYLDGEIDKATYDQQMEEAEIRHQQILINITKEGSKERLQAERQLQSLLINQMQRRQQEKERLEAQYAAMKKDYFGDNPQEAQAKYDADLALLKVVYDREIQAAGDNAAEKLRIEEAFEKAKLALKKKYGLLAEEDTRNAMQKGVAASAEWLQSDGGKAVTGSLNTISSGMSAIFSQMSSIVQAELDMQTAAINKRYDTEIAQAEGNTYKIKKLEKDKEKEIAKAKQEANRKMFAMQVIQAVAQTATNALNAYGSAAAVPVVGYILAPIAAAMAVAAGAMQIATIKKQQQASEAQGYSEGGFTPPGRKDEAVGVVHAGEWVASQKLVNNPRTRPMLEALDYAQRTNTIGSITAADVSRTITAPAILATQSASPAVVVQSAPPTVVVEQNSEYAATMRRLAERLNEPFVTVNTVTGDYGIQKAQDDYALLMKNKSPKSSKK